VANQIKLNVSILVPNEYFKMSNNRSIENQNYLRFILYTTERVPIFVFTRIVFIENIKVCSVLKKHIEQLKR